VRVCGAYIPSGFLLMGESLASGSSNSRMQLRSLSAGPLTASSRALISSSSVGASAHIAGAGAGASATDCAGACAVCGVCVWAWTGTQRTALRAKHTAGLNIHGFYRRAAAGHQVRRFSISFAIKSIARSSADLSCGERSPTLCAKARVRSLRA